MDRCVGAAAMLPETDRRELAIQALAGSATISDLADGHGVSRKFVYRQTDKARTALENAFLPAEPENGVLFELAVSQTWLLQLVVALVLICRSSFRGVVEFLRDLLGVSISLGTVHQVLERAAQQAGAINCTQDLSGIRVGLHDEIFQGSMPVLAGVDAASSYCYLLTAVDQRDADTWACICSTLPSKGCSLIIQLLMRRKVCASARKPLGVTRHAMATCFTFSASMKASPTRCCASPRVPCHGARSWRPGSSAPADVVRTTILSAGWTWRGRLKSKRAGWRATSER
jgi:hypothetical protein